MDGLVSLENVVVMLTSNRPDYIDPAILRPGRIDRKVKVRRPDRDATREIFGIYLTPTLPLDPDFVREYDTPAEARECLIEQTVQYLWRKAPDTEFLQVYLRNGGRRDALLARYGQRRTHQVGRGSRERVRHPPCD
jgi:proteasome-associated ATPase